MRPALRQCSRQDSAKLSPFRLIYQENPRSKASIYRMARILYRGEVAGRVRYDGALFKLCATKQFFQSRRHDEQRMPQRRWGFLESSYSELETAFCCIRHNGENG